MLKTIQGIRTHFKDAARNVQLIEREQLMLDRTKILPEVILDTIIELPTRLHVQMQKYRGAAHYHAEYKVAAREFTLYTASFAEASEAHRDSVLDSVQKAGFGGFLILYNPADEEQTLMEDMLDPEKMAGLFKQSLIHQLSTQLLVCRPVGEWLNDYEAVLSDPEFARNNRFSSYLGQGQTVLDFWRRLNNLPDWSRYAKKVRIDGPGRNDPRFKKPVEARKDKTPPIWQPAPGMT